MNSDRITQLFRDAAFDPRMVEKLCLAYARAADQLHDRGRPDIVNEIIAQRIIALAKEGEIDPRKLADRALSALGFDRA